MFQLDSSLGSSIRDGIARAVAVIGLAGVALIHLLDAPGTIAARASGRARPPHA